MLLAIGETEAQIRTDGVDGIECLVLTVLSYGFIPMGPIVPADSRTSLFPQGVYTF